MRATLIAKLGDLHKQAITERSHYYTASVLRETIDYLKSSRPKRRPKAGEFRSDAEMRAWVRDNIG